MKDWKKIKKYVGDLDVYDRDGVAVLYKNTLYIGLDDITHSELVCSQIYGMNINLDIEPDDRYTSDSDDGVQFQRTEELYDEVAYFGHIIGGDIFWEMYDDGSKEDLLRMISKNSESNNFRHYMFLDYREEPIRII